MSLTQTDQTIIRTIVKEEIDISLDQKLDAKLDEKLAHLVTKEEFYTALNAIDDRFKSVDERFKSIDERFMSIDKRFESVDQRFNEMEKRFDKLDDGNQEIMSALGSLGYQVKGYQLDQTEMNRRLTKLEKKVDLILDGDGVKYHLGED